MGSPDPFQKEFLSLLDSSREARLGGNPQGALILASRAHNLLPSEPAAYHTIALALADLGMHNLAFAKWEEAIARLQPMETVPNSLLDGYREILFGFGCSLLRRGEWKRAWPYWEAGRIFAAWSPFPGTHPWNGESDGNLLVLPEGGYGDLFCFARFLHILHRSSIRPPRMGLGLCVLSVMQCARNWTDLGVDIVHELGSEIPMGQYRYSTSLLSLPGFLNMDSPAQVPPDRLTIKRSEFCRSRVGGKLRIGFCWRAEEAGEQGGRKVRTLPIGIVERIVSSLRKRTGAGMFDLCPGHTRIPGLIHKENCLDTWRGTKYYLASMDLILTVDTAVAHLAGLLGLNTLCLLPFNSDWKWLLDRKDTVWYPHNFKLFWNQTVGWEAEPIIEAVIARLDALSLSGKSSIPPRPRSSRLGNS